MSGIIFVRVDSSAGKIVNVEMWKDVALSIHYFLITFFFLR